MQMKIYSELDLVKIITLFLMTLLITKVVLKIMLILKLGGNLCPSSL